PGTGAVPVEEDNLPELRELLRRRGARLAGPLLGYGSPPLSGLAAELLGARLAADGIEPASFRLPATPELASEGLWRPLRVELPPTACEVLPPDGEAARSSYQLSFALPKGTYATVLLREFTKSGSPVPA
ncbi:MAG: tRNA pseudouridine(13) synthase TruD, partial [Thermoplasmata archaeon]